MQLEITPLQIVVHPQYDAVSEEADPTLREIPGKLIKTLLLTTATLAGVAALKMLFHMLPNKNGV